MNCTDVGETILPTLIKKLQVVLISSDFIATDHAFVNVIQSDNLVLERLRVISETNTFFKKEQTFIRKNTSDCRAISKANRHTRVIDLLRWLLRLDIYSTCIEAVAASEGLLVHFLSERHFHYVFQLDILLLLIRIFVANNVAEEARWVFFLNVRRGLVAIELQEPLHLG
jgi:hypothetical protein